MQLGVVVAQGLAGDDLPQRVQNRDVQLELETSLGANFSPDQLQALVNLVVDQSLHGALAEAKVTEVPHGEPPDLLPLVPVAEHDSPDLLVGVRVPGVQDRAQVGSGGKLISVRDLLVEVVVRHDNDGCGAHVEAEQVPVLGLHPGEGLCHVCSQVGHPSQQGEVHRAGREIAGPYTRSEEVVGGQGQKDH